jgi:hypothetical protein
MSDNAYEICGADLCPNHVQLENRIKDLLQASKAMQDELLRRADIDSDGTRIVNCSFMVWNRFCEAIEEADNGPE